MCNTVKSSESGRHFLVILFLKYSIEVGWFYSCLSFGSVFNSVTVPHLLGLLAEEGRGSFCISSKEEIDLRQDRAVVFRVIIYHLFMSVR